jgi:hypothetical protein
VTPGSIQNVKVYFVSLETCEERRRSSMYEEPRRCKEVSVRLRSPADLLKRKKRICYSSLQRMVQLKVVSVKVEKILNVSKEGYVAGCV